MKFPQPLIKAKVRYFIQAHRQDSLAKRCQEAWTKQPLCVSRRHSSQSLEQHPVGGREPRRVHAMDGCEPICLARGPRISGHVSSSMPHRNQIPTLTHLQFRGQVNSLMTTSLTNFHVMLTSKINYYSRGRVVVAHTQMWSTKKHLSV